MPALDFVPSGSQYDNLRGMLAILQRDFPGLYAGLSDSRVRGWVSEIDSETGRDDDQIRDDIAQYVIGVDRIMETYGVTRKEAESVIVGGNEGGLNFSSLTPVNQTSPEPDADPLSNVPSGSQYDNLRGALQHLQALEGAGYGNIYSGLDPSRVQGWISEIDSGSGRSADQIRDDIVEHIIGQDLASEAYGLSPDEFQQLILGGNEGGLNLSSLTIRPATSPEPDPGEGGGGDDGGGDGGGDDGGGDDGGGDPDPDPDPDTDPEPDPVDFHERVRALFPFLPEQLVDIFADAWSETGDRQLALAEMRQSDVYDQFFPGNRRDDGSLRHTEAEYFSIKDAYRTTYREFGLNPQLFEGRFAELIENDQSPREHAARLGAAFEQVMNNIPEVREAYSQFGNIEMTDQAIFASVIDPNIGDAIVNRRISVAQVAGEGLARGFDVDEDFAGRLASGGVDQMAARTLFSDAEGRLSTLDTLVRRHRDPDDDFDLEEFAEANVFGDAVQNRRIQRALRAEASLFTEQAGTVATSQDLQVRGLVTR